MHQVSRPKIALMTSTFDHRPAKGTALYARKLTERLIENREYEWFLVHFEKTDDPIYQHPGVHDTIIPRAPWPLRFRMVREWLFYWKFRKTPFDLIHWFQPRLYPFFWLAPARQKIATLHAAGDVTAPGARPFSRRLFVFVLRRFHRFLAAVIAVSCFGRDEIIEHYRMPREKITVIYNGGGEDFAPRPQAAAQARLRECYGIEAPFILDVSRLQPHKNIPRLIDAYTLMRQEHPERTEKLVIVGAPHDGAEAIYAHARASAVAADIRFVSYVVPEDLNDCYAAASLFVFPSLNEGFGLPVIEAMASGTPVVTSHTTSLPEIAGDAALCVPPDDARAIALAMVRILADVPLRVSLVEHGMRRAREFTWDGTAKETLALYARVLS